MKLWTKDIEKRAKKFPLYSQEPSIDAKVLVKFFNPYGRGTWIITEAKQQDNGDWLLYGYMHIHEWEWGYVLLSQLEDIRINVHGFLLPIEREMYISRGTKVRDLI